MNQFSATTGLIIHQPRQELRQWCIQMAMGIHAGSAGAGEVIEAAKAIEAYVAEVIAPVPVMKAA